MAENWLQSVGRIDGDSRLMEIYHTGQAREAAETGAPTRAAAQPKAEKAAEKETQATPGLPVTKSDILLRFHIDEETNDITVYLVDRATKQVVRSIPPNEVQKLRAGDLLKLFA